VNNEDVFLKFCESLRSLPPQDIFEISNIAKSSIVLQLKARKMATPPEIERRLLIAIGVLLMNLDKITPDA
jgi:hypothetical protein